MKVAIVGGTGNVGTPIARRLIAEGHAVKILSRGGSRADQLVALGATLELGSFDSGTSGIADFFEGADAAFTMIRSDWSAPGHYGAVADRLAAALRRHLPKRIVHLSSIGADLYNAGHSSAFGDAERVLNGAARQRVVHLRAGWFMENFLSHTEELARDGVLTTSIWPDVPLPLVAVRDVARAAFEELVDQSGAVHHIREVQGPADLTTAQAAEQLGRVLGCPVRVNFIPRSINEPSQDFLLKSSDPAVWRYMVASDAAFNENRARFAQPRSRFDAESTTFATFIRDVWKPDSHRG